MLLHGAHVTWYTKTYVHTHMLTHRHTHAHTHTHTHTHTHRHRHTHGHTNTHTHTRTHAHTHTHTHTGTWAQFSNSTTVNHVVGPRTECEDACTGRHSNAQGIWDRDGGGHSTVRQRLAIVLDRLSHSQCGNVLPVSWGSCRSCSGRRNRHRPQGWYAERRETVLNVLSQIGTFPFQIQYSISRLTNSRTQSYARSCTMQI